MKDGSYWVGGSIVLSFLIYLLILRGGELLLERGKRKPFIDWQKGVSVPVASGLYWRKTTWGSIEWSYWNASTREWGMLAGTPDEAIDNRNRLSPFQYLEWAVPFTDAVEAVEEQMP